MAGSGLEFEAPPERAGERVELTGELTLGRAEGCGVLIDDPRVSRRHARISPCPEGFVVEDLGSPNGTVVNGLRVARQILAPGDLLVFGRARLRFYAPEPPARSKEELGPDLVKPLTSSPAVTLHGAGKEAFYRALGIGDETILDAGPRAAAALLEKTRHFAVLHEVSRALRSAHTPGSMLGRLLELVLEVTGGARGFVVLSEARTKTETEDGDEGGEEADTLPPGLAPASELRLAAARSRGQGEAELEASGPPVLSRTVARHVLAERSAVLSRDPTDDTRFRGAESLFLSDTRALMAVPILLRERVLGALVVESDRDGAFGEADLDLLGVISSTAGQTLENLRLAERREATIRELREAQSRLLEARERLVRSEQLAAIGRLASGLAHEVKNHLSPFMLADMIARKYPDDAEIQSAMEMMLEARQHIVDLVSEVKGFARAEGGAEKRREPTDLARLARAVARFAACDAAVKRHRLDVEVRGEPWASVDVPRVRQLLVNLVKNAADALGAEREGSIVVRVDEVGAAAIIEVIDDGPGIPPEVGARVFEPFFSTKGEAGLGLGLDISRNIARDHEGELEFESEGGRGTRFRLTLPALPE